MFTIEDIKKALNTIRESLDQDVIDCDIINVDNKLKRLTQLTGLSAEANASAKKILHKKELEVLGSLKPDQRPSIISAILKAETAEEIALLEYADRLNSALVHSMDGLRTSISLYKAELTAGTLPGTNS